MAIQWPLVIFSLLAGAGGALLAFVGLSEVLGLAKKARVPAAVGALVLLVVGGCASVAHLAQPANIMAAAANVFSFSGISVELIMLGVNAIVAVAYVLTARGESANATKIVGIVGIVTGVAMTFVVGNGYVMEAQPNWNTPTLPFAYLGSGLATGGALFATLMAALKTDEADFRGIMPWVLGATVVQLVAFLAYGFAIGFAADVLLYWGGAVIVGSVGAIACAAFIAKASTMAYATLVCAVVGGICLRALMWLVGTGFLDAFGTAAVRGVWGV